MISFALHSKMPFRTLASALALVLCATALTAQAHRKDAGQALVDRPSASSSAESDSLAVAAVIRQFHVALEAGDSVAALALLKEDAIILESGAVETREEYRSHHLGSDIAFAQAVAREEGPIRVMISGDVAWATSTSTMRGTFRDRPVNSRSVELMVLERALTGWRIAAIHWSSRSLPG
jgi:ketosteroid isomerase-like protein